jgi:hypothetical protein
VTPAVVNLSVRIAKDGLHQAFGASAMGIDPGNNKGQALLRAFSNLLNISEKLDKRVLVYYLY